jgi:replicative DNA helicase
MIDVGKIPPQACDLEEAVLGALMLEPEAIDNVVGLKPCHFYKDAHQKIFESILKLHTGNNPIDILTVCEELRKSDQLEGIGGPYQVGLLTSKVASASHVDFHSKIIKQKYIQRELIRISSEINNKAYEDSCDVDDLIGFSANAIEKVISDDSDTVLAKSWNDLLKETIGLAETREVLRKKGEVSGIETPLKTLTKYTGGWQNGDLIVLAARPSQGKTAFCISILKKAAFAGESPCLFSLETVDVKLADRIIVGESKVSYDNYKMGLMEPWEWVKISNAYSKLLNLNIHIDDKSNASMDYIKNKCRILKKKGKCSLILIDYLQLAQEEKTKNTIREQEVAIMSRKAKLMAKELDVPVIILSQVNRGVESRSGDKRPQLSDLRESGAIEADADLVMFIFRSEYYGILEDQDGNSLRGVGEIIVSKNKEGKVGPIKFRYNESLTVIYDFEEEIPFPAEPKKSIL